jgi:hypothetical protein
MKAFIRVNQDNEIVCRATETCNLHGEGTDYLVADESANPGYSWTPEYEDQGVTVGVLGPDPMEIVLAKKANEIKTAFYTAAAQPVPIEVNGITFQMDGKKDSGRLLNDGITLAELAGETTIDVIDYYNVPHFGISLVDAKEIAKQQALAFRANYYIRAGLRYQVEVAPDVATLTAITWPT